MEISAKDRQFVQARPMLYGIAYRMLGSFSDAEDTVQDAWLRWRDADPGRVQSARAYLAATVSRLCIDRHRRRKSERLLYTGPWLPEPIDDETLAFMNEPETTALTAESVSMAFLLLLQKLPPVERAVFVLKECFDLGHNEIASMLDIRSAHSRQLLKRARLKVRQPEEISISATETQALLESFYNAATTGDLEQLHALMAEDIIAYSDGGGRASAALIPLAGVERVATVLMHLINQQTEPLAAEWRPINGLPGLIFRSDGHIHSSHCVTIREGKIHRIYTMRNPDKLGYIQ